MRPAPIFTLAAALMLGACGSNDDASTLRDAANQSDPAAAQVLQNEANAIETQGSAGGMSEGNSSVQQAMENAGAASATAPDAMPQQAGPSTGAKPHGANEPVPPPQTSSSPPKS